MNCHIERASLFIFLVRHCYGSIYREDARGNFASSFRFIPKRVFDAEKLRVTSLALQKVVLLSGDYRRTLHHAAPRSFFYLDPPYKPLDGRKDRFYTYQTFDDDRQWELKSFCDDLTARGASWLLSNSAPSCGFFDTLYGPDYTITRVQSPRGLKRKGQAIASELLIANYSQTAISLD